jgi:hypothetical protein
MRPEFERSERPSAETTPVVTVCWRPSGLPTAIAIWPTRSHPQHGEVAAGVVANQIGVELAAVGERDANLRSAVNDVAIGQQVAVRREQEARTGAAARAAAARIGGRAVFDGNEHDRLLDPLQRADHGARVGVEQGVVV